LFYTTTLFCDEINIERYKPFVHHWLTTKSWEQSTLVTKYYILITNALLSMTDKIKKND